MEEIERRDKCTPNRDGFELQEGGGPGGGRGRVTKHPCKMDVEIFTIDWQTSVSQVIAAFKQAES